MNTFRTTDATLERAGLRIIDLIQQNVAAGLDADGNPLAPYSELYAALKIKRSPQQGGKVSMSVTGSMLRSLAVLRTGDDTITIGADNAEDALKLLYHNATGAGRSRVIRRILGITEEQSQDEKLVEILSSEIIIEGSFL